MSDIDVLAEEKGFSIFRIRCIHRKKKGFFSCSLYQLQKCQIPVVRVQARKSLDLGQEY
jgi:hypothetical protein